MKTTCRGAKRQNSHAASSLAAAGHDYGGVDNFDEDFPPLPVTPSKSPAHKKKAMDMGIDPALLAQFEFLKTLINSRADTIESRIALLENKFESVSAEMKAVTTRVTALEQKVTGVEQPLKHMRRWMDAMETRSRRNNLRLDGIPESVSEENIRATVTTICQKLVPEKKDLFPRDIDVAHRLGRRIEEGSRPRTVILHFVSRDCRQAVWRAARTAPYMEQHGLRFKEDLSDGDRERRTKLWPYVKSAREAGKRAHYVGGRAFIVGEGEIILDD